MDLQIIVETQRFKQSLRAILTNIYDELMAYDKKRPSAAINVKTMYSTIIYNFSKPPSSFLQSRYSSRKINIDSLILVNIQFSSESRSQSKLQLILSSQQLFNYIRLVVQTVLIMQINYAHAIQLQLRIIYAIPQFITYTIRWKTKSLASLNLVSNRLG